MLNQGVDHGPAPSGRKKGLDRFCGFIHREFKSLGSITTEQLAREYRKFFRLPLVIDEASLKAHCRQLGISDLYKKTLPPGLGGYNLRGDEGDEVAVNASQWSGVHGITFFHEVFELLQTKYHRLDRAYAPLHGAARESRADKFGTCIVLPQELQVDLSTILGAIPTLQLHLGQGVVQMIFRRIFDLTFGACGPSIVRYVRVSHGNEPRAFRVISHRLNKSARFLPRKARKIFQSLLPQVGDTAEKSSIAQSALEYQGPVFLRENRGFDIFQLNDLAVLCLPVFVDGTIIQILIYVFRRDVIHNVEHFCRSLDPKTLAPQFQAF